MIRVNLWGEFLGVIDYNHEKGESYFAFHPEFDWKKYNVAPLLMPYSENSKREFGPFSGGQSDFFEGLPPMIADALPDAFGNDVLKIWMRENGMKVTDLTPEMKLSYVAGRALGALEFEPQLIEKQKPTEVNLDRLSKISNAIQAANELPENITKKTFHNLFLVGTSAGGARPKAVISINFDSRQMLHSNEPLEGFTPVIIKFDKPLESDPSNGSEQGIIEYIYHKMALDAKIVMAPCGLFKNGNFKHFYTERFDRTSEGKLHMQTLAGISGLKPTEKHDYQEIFQVLLDLHLPYSDLEQLYRRMVFNYLTANDDCHTKNMAFLMNKKGEWRLSPAYDLTFPYDPLKVWKRPHPISINNKSTNVGKEDFEYIAKKYGIKGFNRILEDTQNALQNWNKYATRYKLSSHNTTNVEKHFNTI